MSIRPTTKHDIQRDEENITRPGFDVITNVLVSGSISMLSAGVDQGTGQVILFSPTNGWVLDNGTWTCISTDSPIFNVSINANITGSIGVGNKIQLTQSGQNGYFIVHGVGITGSTSYLNLYGGTDFSLVTGSAITSPFYSQAKSPYNFPVSPAKWTVSLDDTSDQVQASPNASQVYNPGSLSISAPIGAWNVEVTAFDNLIITTAAVIPSIAVNLALSTANNSISTQTLRAIFRSAMPIATAGQLGNTLFIKELLTVTAKTTYYLVVVTGVAGATSIGLYGSVVTTKVRLICAYL